MPRNLGGMGLGVQGFRVWGVRASESWVQALIHGSGHHND